MRINLLTLAGSLLSAALAVAAPKSMPTMPGSTDPAQLLQEFRNKTAVLSHQATEMQTVTRNYLLSFQTDNGTLDDLRDAVNDASRTLAQLEDVRAAAPAYEQKAIDEAQPLLNEIVTKTTDAIGFLKAKPHYVWAPDFQTAIDTVASDAVKLSKTMGEFERYARTHQEEMHLEQSLGVGGSN